MDPDSYISSFFCQYSLHDPTIALLTVLFSSLFILFISVILSTAEVAFFSLRPKDISLLHEDESRKAAIVRKILMRFEHFLGMVIAAKYLACTALAFLFSFATFHFFGIYEYYLLAFPLVLFVLPPTLLLFEDIIPRNYALRNPLGFVYRWARIITFFEYLCRPLSSLLANYSPIVDKSLTRKKYDFSVDELSMALEQGTTDTHEEKDMLEGILRFYNKTASEIMTSRMDVEDLEIHLTFKEVLETILQSGYSRIPVYEKSQDNIKGILYIKDLLPFINKPANFRWQSLLRQAYFVPETKQIDDLLEEFRTNKIHMAIVVDEYGGTSGIVTMEDIIEEIVGEIEDEYDTDEEVLFKREADGSVVFEAKVLLEDFYRVIDEDPAVFNELTEDVETLGGLLLEIKGDFPEKDEVIEYKEYRFKILEMESRRILKVHFSVQS